MKKLLLIVCGAFGLWGAASAQPAFDPFDAFGHANAWQDVGRVYYLAASYCPANALPTDGRLVPASRFPTLSRVIGSRFGGDAVNAIALPTHAAPGGLTSCIVATEADIPPENTPLVSQVIKGNCTEHLLPASGRLLAVNNDLRLFSLVGFTYGGDGRNAFGLPTLPGWCVSRDGVYPVR